MKKFTVLFISVIMLFATFTMTACGEDRIYSGHYEQITTLEAVNILKNEVQSVNFNSSPASGKGYELSLWAKAHLNSEYQSDGNYFNVKNELEVNLIAKSVLNGNFVNSESFMKGKNKTVTSKKALSSGITLVSEESSNINRAVYYDGIYSYVKTETSAELKDNYNSNNCKDTDSKCAKHLSATDTAVSSVLSTFNKYADININAVFINASDLSKAKIFTDKNDPSQYKLKIQFTDPSIIAEYYTDIIGGTDFKNVDDCVFTFVYNNATKELIAFRQSLHITSSTGEINVDARVRPYEDKVSIPNEVTGYYEV